jgi:hypothetical protein
LFSECDYTFLANFCVPVPDILLYISDQKIRQNVFFRSELFKIKDKSSALHKQVIRTLKKLVNEYSGLVFIVFLRFIIFIYYRLKLLEKKKSEMAMKSRKVTDAIASK